MTLSEALDKIYDYSDWRHPIRLYLSEIKVVSPYEAWAKLQLRYREEVVRLIGHEPAQNEE